MKNLKYLFGILSIYLIFSCKPLQTITVIKEKIRIDTIRDYKIITKFNAIHDTLLIDNPCDSAGILTTFYSRIILPQGKIIIRSYRGKIQTTINIDSIKSVYESKYRNKVTSDVTNSNKIITKNVIPKWAIWVMAIGAIFTFLYIKEKVSIFVK
jgi:hypothetical protein